MNKLYLTLGSLLSLVAVHTASFACWWILYQPKIPKNLR